MDAFSYKITLVKNMSYNKHHVFQPGYLICNLVCNQERGLVVDGGGLRLPCAVGAGCKPSISLLGHLPGVTRG